MSDRQIPPTTDLDRAGRNVTAERPELEPTVAAVLDTVPEFVPAYLALVEEFDDDPGAAVVLTGLADFVAARVELLGEDLPALHRALAAVETVASAGGESGELVAYAFLDSLSPDQSRLVEPWMGTATRALLDEMDA
jgi:hypothetical protein